MDVAALKEKIESLDPKAHKSLRDALSAKYRRLTGENGEKSEKDHTLNSFAIEFAASLEGITREYRPGTIDYVKATYPEFWKRIVAAENTLTATWISGGAEEFHQALDEWCSLNLQAIEIFKRKSDRERNKLEV